MKDRGPFWRKLTRGLRELHRARRADSGERGSQKPVAVREKSPEEILFLMKFGKR
jgi:hypothetical protein